MIFYVPSLDKFEVENKLNENLAQFESRFQIKANASGPNPCNNYVCPTSKNNSIEHICSKILFC